jgi:transcriptional regulator with XRE-family HTH domain
VKRKLGDNVSRRFAPALNQAIKRRGITLTELAQSVDSSYEHMRRLTRGHAYPSRRLLRSLAERLGQDFESFEMLVDWDKIHDEYGCIPKFLGLSEEMKPLQNLIPKLSPMGQEIVLAAAKVMLKHQEMD